MIVYVSGVFSALFLFFVGVKGDAFQTDKGLFAECAWKMTARSS